MFIEIGKWCEGAQGYGEGGSKCLLFGGYTVTKRENIGAVATLDPKVKCNLSVGPRVEDNSLFVVNSEPFGKTVTISKTDYLNPTNIKLKFERFIIAALYVFFSYFHIDIHNQGIFNIVGDPSFYSENGKSGLGSSAATTISVLRALMDVFNIHNDELLFKFAAIAHSYAQENIGSCFDISAAIWGTQIYRRPSPNLININSIDTEWDNEHLPLNLPKGVYLQLISSSFEGSSTPKLVKQFYQNAEKDQEPVNQLIEKINIAIESLSQPDLHKISVEIKSLTTHLRNISVNWNMPIIPDEVYKEMLELEKVDGVIGVISPGAGGYDSLAILSTKKFEEILGHRVIASTCF